MTTPTSVAVRWSCRLCRASGIDGPDGWRKHFEKRHEGVGGGAGSSTSFGFVGERPGRSSHHGFYHNPDPARPVWAFGFVP